MRREVGLARLQGVAAAASRGGRRCDRCHLGVETFADNADGIDIHPTSVLVFQITACVLPPLLMPQFNAPPAPLSVLQDTLPWPSSCLRHSTTALAEVESVHPNHGRSSKGNSLTGWSSWRRRGGCGCWLPCLSWCGEAGLGDRWPDPAFLLSNLLFPLPWWRRCCQWTLAWINRSLGIQGCDALVDVNLFRVDPSNPDVGNLGRLYVLG